MNPGIFANTPRPGFELRLVASSHSRSPSWARKGDCTRDTNITPTRALDEG